MAARSVVLKRTGPIRVVVAKVGLDGHDVGARVVARGLRDAGMEVIYTGIRRTPEQVVATAIDEDADVIGISILSGAHLPLVSRICALMRDQHMDDVLVVVGGVVPDDDVAKLEQDGVSAVFHPPTRMAEVVDHITRHVRGAGGRQEGGSS